MIKYSIIMPCFNMTSYLKKTMNSIWKNRMDGVEIVIIDDGSEDDFLGCIENFFDVKLTEGRTSFVYKKANVIIVRQENKGVSAARNKGIEVATGEYILFVDPDDYISRDAIEKIEKIVSRMPEFDMLIMGFNRVYEDGRIPPIEKYIPHKQYDVNSNSDAINKILPMYLGYSIENMKIWGKDGIFLSHQIEFGSVWRNVYNRKFLVEHEICFNENIKLNEDGMFNANCVACSNRIISSDEAFYYYTVRPSGAFMKRRGSSLVNNKLQLLEERYKIVRYLVNQGYHNTVEDFAGSNVMSVIELMVKCSFYDRKRVNEYVKHPLVCESIQLMPKIGIKKVDIPVLMLKLGLSDFLYLGIRVAKKLGIKFTT